ncbi:ATP-binding protein [Butyrivibrio sp. INlla14]|uniref:ATP-binding protein n=1 Tax=Butyrivibrio sp. INlla14 TaxID=1520808 RepID=UPI000876249E|nr:ATP-binding protein [Butyrivibrio sp. INlla14]SCY65875.1 Anti-sigma regulatory factor (Ser/Thr protein kinase) [Butyrivibrio sp. INlla14]
MERLEVQATKENLLEVSAFVEGYLEKLDCPMKTMMQISVAVEEIYINIASYAYGDSIGMAEILIDHDQALNSVSITFKDSGVFYDPLAKEDPDITLSAEERAIGGLGIFMVKKSMDDMKYKYEDGKNVLTIVKKL